MKKSLLLLSLFFISVNSANAQFTRENAIYSTGEINFGNYLGADINLNYVYREKNSFKIGYSGNFRRPQSQPADYSSGFKGIISVGLANPFDRMENFQIAAGKIYKLNPSGTIRMNFSVGLGYTIIREPENWQRIEDAFLLENYIWDYGKHNTISLTINPKIEFPFTRFYGLTISPMVQINKDRTYFGVGIGQMVGLLRKRNN